ncbi:MAG: hypothetical protein IMW98_08570 [Firmicutes bacterium]|nr:hypothetical protein [Bacillota bacterium]MBE3590859.1 hypothetical protein [Bacillota bacterium]
MGVVIVPARRPPRVGDELRCPYCSATYAADPMSRRFRGQRETYGLRCRDCGGEYAVTWTYDVPRRRRTATVVRTGGGGDAA